MPIRIILKPTYEVPISGVVGANAQLGFVGGRITVPFRINGVKIVFGDDHIDNVLHYLLVDDTNNVSATSISNGTNLIPPASPTPYFIGHSMFKHVTIIKDFPEGGLYLKCHVVNNNAYQIQVNISFIIEEL